MATLVPSAYAILSTDSSATVVEFPFLANSWQKANDFCSGLGLKLVSYPVSLKDRAVMSIRMKPYFFVDLQRQIDGSYAALSSDLVLPSNYPFPWYPKNPDGGINICMAIADHPFTVYDFPCNLVGSGPYTAICAV
ncbi:uncharacterized protein LOC125178926 [Hyalella azteca]|uniref:Uncharacterized protein LOC125178926 n=1 Tax=Hyalella azteca TaxID=294128 RepID=A0A979FRK7_HYAAZ|nr:uncharacterized protein LOC125178926 [Hyalella azteca]